MVNIDALLKPRQDESISFLISILNDKTVVIKHPKLDIATYPRSSKINGMANVIHFSDVNLNNHWFLIQVTRLADGYYSDGHLVNPRDMPAVSGARKLLDSGEISFNLNNSSNKVDGFLFHQKRPYHFFYDQFVNYFKLSNIRNIDKYCFINDESFYSEVIGGKFKKKKSKGCYFFPCTVDGNYFDANAHEMHHYLKNNSKEIKLKSDLTIWLGITGQKRSWLEQVDGYVEIIKRLAVKYNSISVLIDGWTNYEKNDRSKNVEDLEVYNLIVKKLSYIPSISMVNLINKNYKTKIAYSNACDYFIANSGTGCMVPFMFSNKKGVIHGNGQLNTFQRCYDQSIRIIPANKIVAEKSPRVMINSYSIEWQVIYNCLMDLMNDVERLQESSFKVNSKIIFQEINVSREMESAEVLKTLALKFEESGDIKTAYSIMCKALEQRPSGPYIKEKLEEWKVKLTGE